MTRPYDPSGGEHRGAAPVAVVPPEHSTGTRVHIYSKGYRPGGKRRENDRDRLDVALCGAVTSLVWGLGERERPTGRAHEPLTITAEALTEHDWYRWCPLCVGRYLERAGVLAQVMHEHGADE